MYLTVELLNTTPLVMVLNFTLEVKYVHLAHKENWY